MKGLNLPFYEYVCEECGRDMEVLQKVGAPAPGACEHCQSPALRRKLSRVAFRLKGSGWYETDFKTGEKRHLASDDSESGDDKKDKKDASGDKKESGGDKKDKKDSGGDKKESGGEQKKSGGDKKESGGEKKKSGGDAGAKSKVSAPPASQRPSASPT